MTQTSTGKAPQEAPGNQVSLYYLFSFAFTRLPVRDTVSGTEERVSFGKRLAQWLGAKEGQGLYHFSAWHCAEEREPLMGRPGLYTPFHHLSLSSAEENAHLWPAVRLYDSADRFREGPEPAGTGAFDVRINKHIALFESGMGLLDICLTFEDSPPAETIRFLTQRWLFPCLERTDGEGGSIRRTLHEEYYSEVSRLNDALNRGLAAVGYVGQEVRWLDLDARFVWRSDEERVFCEPSVAVLVATPHDQISKGLAGEQGAVGALKRRVVDHLDVPSEAAVNVVYGTSSAAINNLYPEQGFAVFVHGNVLLVLHDDQATRDQLQAFRFVLFRTYCGVRGCWHMYSILSEEIDEAIRSLETDFSTFSDGKLLALRESQIISTFFGFLRTIDIEDPFVRGVNLTSFRAVYSEGCKAFRLPELRDVVRAKLHDLADVYELVSSYRLRSAIYGSTGPIAGSGDPAAVRAAINVGITLMAIGWVSQIALSERPELWPMLWAARFAGGFGLLLCMMGLAYYVRKQRMQARARASEGLRSASQSV